MRVRALAREAGTPWRTIQEALNDGLISATGGGSIDRPYEIEDAEAARVVAAARLARRYGLAFTVVLRAQRAGRVSESGGRLVLAPVPEDGQVA